MGICWTLQYLNLTYFKNITSEFDLLKIIGQFIRSNLFNGTKSKIIFKNLFYNFFPSFFLQNHAPLKW